MCNEDTEAGEEGEKAVWDLLSQCCTQVKWLAEPAGVAQAESTDLAEIS